MPEINVSIDGVEDTRSTFETAKDWAGGDARWVVGTHVEYAVYLEFGTSKMPPYPFLRPAVEYVMSNKADAIADQANSVDDVIAGIALAIERRAKHYATTGNPPGPDVQTDTLRSSIRAEEK